MLPDISKAQHILIEALVVCQGWVGEKVQRGAFLTSIKSFSTSGIFLGFVGVCTCEGGGWGAERPVFFQGGIVLF